MGLGEGTQGLGGLVVMVARKEEEGAMDWTEVIYHIIRHITPSGHLARGVEVGRYPDGIRRAKQSRDLGD
jgi:hypothetical protein